MELFLEWYDSNLKGTRYSEARFFDNYSEIPVYFKVSDRSIIDYLIGLIDNPESPIYKGRMYIKK